MKSKLISYLLPMYPAAALLVADWLDIQLNTDQNIRNRALALVAVFTGVLGFVGFGISRWALSKAAKNAHFASDVAREFPPPVWNWVIHSIWIGILGGAIATIFILAKRPRKGVIALFCTMGAFVTMAVIEGFPAMDATKMAPLQKLARQIGQSAKDGWPIAIHIAGPRRPSVFFYMPDSLFLRQPLPTTVGENGLILERGETSEMLKFIADNPRGQILTDSDHRIKLVSAQLSSLTDQGPDETIGKELRPKVTVTSLSVIQSSDRWEILQFDKSATAP